MISDASTTSFNFSTSSVGLVLSGGGALGFAHIGAIQAFEDHGIPISEIAGSSMGAIIGTIYCAGYTPAEMLKMIQNDKLYKITRLMTFRPTFLNSGLSTHRMLQSLIRELIPHNSFEGLQRKMHICVVNLNHAEWEIVNSGNELDKWVAASASIPGIFTSIKHEEQFYVDGGLLNNMPAQALEGRCNIIFGIDVIPHREPQDLKKPIDTVKASVRAVQHLNSSAGRKLCTYVIEPKGIDEFHEFSFESWHQLYHHGYESVTRFFIANPQVIKIFH